MNMVTENIPFGAAPMYSFNEWVKTKAENEQGAIHKWADKLIELGASWDSFRRPSQEVVNDLCAGGIPLLAARDIYTVAANVVAQTTMPMAIFWDLENIPIPSTSSASEVLTRLKKILAPHGNLSQFRGYASIGLGNIPEHKRSELQLGGCTLVDCPHLGRKEVADKMIIIDAMEFAFLNPTGTLCFITGDADYAYLLAVLQKNPKLKTIVISKGTIQSMLHVNCHMKMRWETDILQLRSTSMSIRPPPGFDSCAPQGVDPEGNTTKERSYARVTQTRSTTTSNNEESSKDDFTLDSDDLNNAPDESPFEVLTVDEGWTDDAELLRTIVHRGSSLSSVTRGPGGQGAMKSIVSSMLRETNPARFPDKESVQQFLQRAVEQAVVIETQEGPNCLLHIPMNSVGDKNTMSPSISLSSAPPSSVEMLPKTLEMAQRLPFILFAPKRCAPHQQGDIFPPKTFVQTSICKKWFILMFNTLTSAQRAVSETVWLKSSVLVDWRRAVVQTKQPALSTSDTIERTKCEACGSMYPDTDMLFVGEERSSHCIHCFEANDSWSDQEKREAVECVTAALKFMAEQDDYRVNEGILKKTILLRHPEKCKSKKQAGVWIAEALKLNMILEFKREGIKSKQLCLPLFEGLAKIPPIMMDTTKEEEHIINLLWSKGGVLPRHELVANLVDTFQSMSNQGARSALFLNARESGKFFVAKGPYHHVVGLTYEDASTALSLDKYAREQAEAAVGSGAEVTVEDNHSSSSDENSSDTVTIGNE